MGVRKISSEESGFKVLLVITGGIAAYKCLELVRRGRERGWQFTCVLSPAAREFVTPLSLAALAESKVYSELFSLTDEAEMGHIQLSRAADVVLVAPATADMLAKMANGHANDLASTVLMATDKPVLFAPAMNPEMWAHSANQRNIAQLQADGLQMIGPEAGLTACGEVGLGRMSEPVTILDALAPHADQGALRLKGKKAVVTSGPTHEAIDPVRYIANRSSGRQGHALAEALAKAGADVTLVTGPVTIPDPQGVRVRHVQSARDMAQAVEQSLPADIAIFAAAVADWRPKLAPDQKLKKEVGGTPASLELIENPDILATIAHRTDGRPALVIGFAAETQDLVRNAHAKLKRKACDWIVANDVGVGSAVFGGTKNRVTIVRGDGSEEAWPELDKAALSYRLVDAIADALE